MFEKYDFTNEIYMMLITFTFKYLHGATNIENLLFANTSVPTVKNLHTAHSLSHV